MTYTDVSKPTGATYTSVAKPSSGSYTDISKPSQLVVLGVGTTMGLLIPLTRSSAVTEEEYVNINKPT